MHLTQNGNRVTGTFEYKGGTIDGTISGNRLTGRWTQTNGSGTIDFIMSADGNSFTGNYDGNKWWNGKRAFTETPNTAVWTGTWNTSWSGGGARMHLTQNGNRVTGTFEYKGGTIDGTISGNRLTGRWTQTNGSGTIDFIMSADGNSFTGNYDGNKWWNGKRLQ